MYQVFDTGRSADTKNTSVTMPCWDVSSFNTFDEAVNYATSWLGGYAPENYEWELGKLYNYSIDSYVVIMKV